MLFLWIMVLVIGIAYLAHRSTTFLPTLGVVAVYLLVMGTWSQEMGWLLVIFWLLLAVVATTILLPDLRRQYFTKPLFSWLQKVLPPMSKTERDAIDTGTVWWDGELFSGRPDWDKLLAYPKAQLTEEEQEFIDGPTEELCAMVSNWEINQAMDLSPVAWEHIKTYGFFGLIIPKKYGGKGFSSYAHSQIAMKLATRSGDLASTVLVPNSLGPAALLLDYGTDEQCKHYLPRLARGDDIPCFAMTGPMAGSDASAMPDTGVICSGEWRGNKTLGLRLNWEKRYITLSPVATLLGLAFKAYDPDHLLGEKEDLGISIALIPTDTPGVKIGRRHVPLNAAFMNGPNSGKDVFIPLEFLIGGQNMLGKGWTMLMNCLSVGRSISLPAVSTGAAKFTSLVTGQYAQVREQFNAPLSAFEGIQEALARIAGNAWLMDSARMLTANAIDSGENPSVLSTILKYHLTERGRECISHAMDVHGGKGIIMGPNNYLGRNWQSAPIFITVEGANILSRNLMIFGQGAIRCHPFLLKEMALTNYKDYEQAVKEFDNLLMQHISFTVRNAATTLVLNFGIGLFEKVPGNHLSQNYFRALNRQAAIFALLADVSMILMGGKLKRRERLSARLGDVLSHMYLASAALKRYHDLDSPDYIEPLFTWAMEESLGKAERALDELLRNFPNKALSCCLRVIVFPFGLRHTGPSDKLDAKVAAVIGRAKGDQTLEELLMGCYRPKSAEDPVGALQYAYDLLSASYPLQKKLRAMLKSGQIKPVAGEHAIDAALHAGVLQPAEAQTLHNAEIARRNVINVDDFSKEEVMLAEGKVR
ncbi:acyl-CoA dehydrogenase [Candidatus Pseudomonas adelgestsugas]|uniref:Acyl-coenzyme A dehydrogenase n=1 Tax=Candidatus Pseudomonas adelgestsugas TaxID=1302376 RepID=A0ABX5R8J3_9PSED|nr:acyl-CoA dehydrogenase [Candidatus Pseudomonas adelgestsugas]QAX81970.1 Acyl-coenzyme A dehydrogenase [Candidatus Pseudomonas adelgestsugas]